MPPQDRRPDRGSPSRRPPTPIHAILFDLDGVLVETFEAWMEVVEACRERRGYPRLGREAILRAWGQGLDAVLARRRPRTR